MIPDNGTVFKVKSPDGKIWEIPESNIDAAIARGGEVIDQGTGESQLEAPQQQKVSPESSQAKKIQSPDGRIWEIPEHNVQAALDRGGKLVEVNTPQEELSYGDRALQFGRGLATIPAVGADLVNTYVAAPALNAVGGAAELAAKGAGVVSSGAEEFLNDAAQKAYGARDFYKESNLAGNVSEAFNEAAGKDITPKDTTGKILNAAGEFSFPVSNVVKGAKTTGQVLGAIGKHLGIAGSGAIALEGTPRLTDEGTTGRVVEDFLATLTGMALGDKGLSAAKQKIVGSTENILEKLLNKADKTSVKAASSSEPNIFQKGAAKALSFGANPNLEVNAAARAEGIDLPFEVALGGKFQKFLANTGLKSLFVTKAYNNVIENADRDMINAVKSKIDQINPMQLDGELASINAKEFLKSEESAIKSESGRLYGRQSSILNEADKVKPLNGFEYANKILPEISPASPSKDMQFVATRISRVGQKFGWLPDLSKYEDSPQLINKIKESWGKGNNLKDISAKEIDIQLKAFKNDLKYEKDIPGIKNLLNGFVSALEKDLGTVANKEFLEARSEANKYFKENMGERIRTSMAEALLKGEVPSQAFTFMQSAPDIRQLKKIMGNSEAANEIITSLKRAKLEQILVSNIMDSSGTITYSKLSNLFNKAPEKQALLKELLGNQYAGMKKLANISQGFVTAGKEFGNPSRTALAARDFAGIKDLISLLGTTVGSTASILAGSAALHGMSLTAALEPAGIRMLSWIASDKKIVNTAIKYAEASQKAKLRDKEVLGNRLTRMVGNFLKHQSNEVEKYPQAAFSLTKNFRDESTKEKLDEKKKISP